MIAAEVVTKDYSDGYQRGYNRGRAEVADHAYEEIHKLRDVSIKALGDLSRHDRWVIICTAVVCGTLGFLVGSSGKEG